MLGTFLKLIYLLHKWLLKILALDLKNIITMNFPKFRYP